MATCRLLARDSSMETENRRKHGRKMYVRATMESRNTKCEEGINLIQDRKTEVRKKPQKTRIKN